MGIPVEVRPEMESNAVEEPARIIGTDWDGVRVKRHRVAIWTSNFKELGIFQRGAKSHSVLESTPDMDHTPMNVSPKGLHRLTDRLNIYFQSRRSSIPEADRRFREEFDKGVPVIIISGRRATLDWDRATREQANREGTPYTDVILKPVTRDKTKKKEISGIDSKIHAIIENDVTEFYEDNRKTAIRVARRLPNVQVNYIDYGAHIKKADLEALSNLHVITKAEWFRSSVQRLKGEVSNTRNSDYRRFIEVVNPIVRLLDRVGITGLQATGAGTAIAIAGIEVAERKHRSGKHSVGKTTLAGLSLIGGWIFDLLDGKLARLKRDKMTDEKAKERDEMVGQIADSGTDGIMEGWMATSAAYTAYEKRDWFGVNMALAQLALTSAPRAARAIAESRGKEVKETYKIKRFFTRLDLRVLGTSFGRKGPNLTALFVKRIKKVPVQGIAHGVGALANGIVAAERLITAFNPKIEKTLSPKEIRQAKVRATVLGTQTLAYMGLAWYLKKRFLAFSEREASQKLLADGVKELTWDSPELRLPKPELFPTFYAPVDGISQNLIDQVERISGGHLEQVFAYGSTVGGVATPDSRIDLWGIARDPEDFYRYVARGPMRRIIKLGTFVNPRFHSWWNKRKANFYLGEIQLDGTKRGIKLGIIGHDEFLKHARGGREDSVEEGKGKGRLWVPGRLHKAAFVPLLDETDTVAQQELRQAFNQARIDGMWLALGLVSRRFTFDEIAEKYTDLSYAADGRIEGGDKSKSLLYKKYDLYKEMLGAVLKCFVDVGIIKEVKRKPGNYEKVMSLSEETVRRSLLKAQHYAIKVNIPYNTLTIGPLKGLVYEFEKTKRVVGRSLKRRFKKAA